MRKVALKEAKQRKRKRRSERESPARARMRESRGQKGREGERHPKKLRTRTRERGERNVLTRRFLSELPKLIISSGLAEPCQEQEPTAKPPARPGPPCSHRYPHPSPPPPTPQPPARSPALGPNRRRCLPACLFGPGRTWHIATGLLLVQEF